MADDMDVPPLDDLSNVLEKILHSKDVRTYNNSSRGQMVITDCDSCTIDVSILLSLQR